MNNKQLARFLIESDEGKIYSATEISDLRRSIKDAEYQYKNMKAGEPGGSALSNRIDTLKAELKTAIKSTRNSR